MSTPESQSPGLGEVLASARKRTGMDIRCGCPAVIERWDATLRQADVTPVNQDVFEDDTEDTVWLEDKPTICNVPVIFPGGKGFSITWPLQKGDFVWLAFADESIDKWLAGGGTSVDPLDERRHSANDAVAYAGLRPFNAPGRAGATGAVEIGLDSGTLEGAALGATLKTYLDSLYTALGGLVAEGISWGAGPQPTVPAVESTTVKITP